MEIDKFRNADYRYRIVVAKELWTSVIARLAAEQSWTNFKNEAARFQGANGADYTCVLHDVWELMYRFQESAPEDLHESDRDSQEHAARWDGITLVQMVKRDTERQELANCARNYDWPRVFEILGRRPELVNATRPGGQSLFAPLHQAAHGGASVEVVNRLISLGAWRTLRNAAGETPLDVARRSGHDHLTGILTPVYRRTVPEQVLAAVQGRFHNLIREIAKDLVSKNCLRLPELEPMLEFDRAHFWFAVPGMYGGFKYWLVAEGPDARRAVQSWCRVVTGSGRQYDITPLATTLVDKAFV